MASEPPPTKKIRPTSIGTSRASRSESSSDGGVAKPTQFVKKGSVRSWASAASAISGHGP
jgi:hypothetical protein